MTYSTSIDLRNVHLGNLLKICIPDPAGVDPIRIVGVEKNGQAEGIGRQLNHFNGLGRSDRIFNQDQGTFLVPDFKGFLTAKDGPTTVKSSFNHIRLNSKESCNGNSCQGIVNVVKATNIDVVVLALNPEMRRILSEREQIR